MSVSVASQNRSSVSMPSSSVIISSGSGFPSISYRSACPSATTWSTSDTARARTSASIFATCAGAKLGSSRCRYAPCSGASASIGLSGRPCPIGGTSTPSPDANRSGSRPTSYTSS